MQRALLAALFLGPLCALLGVFVTARKMAFFSDTIAHAALTGIALGFWWGLAEPTAPMVVFSLLVAGAILWLKENTELLTDTIMALLLAGSVATGILIISLLQGFRGELHRYLFGDILAIGPMDVVFAAFLFAGVGAWVFYQLSSLTLLTTQEEMAYVCGIKVRWLNYLFVVVLTLTVAISIRLLGIILVTSLLVIPPAAARNLSRNLRQQILLSIGVGLIGGIGGVFLSYLLDVPAGPAIVLVCIGIFIIFLVAGRSRARQTLARV
jgi:zinc transport system permease protein